MNISAEELSAWVAGFLWPFIRIAALFTVAPILSAQVMPVKVRVGMAVAITLVVAPMVAPAPYIDPASGEGLLVIAAQLLTGLALGFTLRLVFAAVESGGHMIGQTMGLGFAQMMDPANGIAVPMLSQFYTVLATLIFLSLNGHLVLIQVLVESFNVIPIAPQTVSSGGIWVLLSWSSWIFKGAVIMAMPVVVALLMVNVSFGVMMRAAPQLNIFVVGFPVMLCLGFVFIFVSLPNFIPQFTDLLDKGLFMAGEVVRE